MTAHDIHQTRFKAELDHVRDQVELLKGVAAKARSDRTTRFDRYLTALDEKRRELRSKLETIDDLSQDKSWNDLRDGLNEIQQRLAVAKMAARSRFH